MAFEVHRDTGLQAGYEKRVFDSIGRFPYGTFGGAVSQRGVAGSDIARLASGVAAPYGVWGTRLL